MENTTKVLMILNHNTIMCETIDGKEKRILFSKGIGYSHQVGDYVSMDEDIARNLLVLEERSIDDYRALLNQVKDPKIVDLVQQIVAEANLFFDHKISSNLHITLLDHINFAFERIKQNIEITYPFLSELSILYPKEFEFSLQAMDLIRKTVETPLPESELGFIVMHIHAAITDKSISHILEMNAIKYDIKDLIEKLSSKKVDITGRYYVRFINHIEYAITRSKNNVQIMNNLLDSLSKTAAVEFQYASEVAKLLESKYHISVNDTEIAYMALHIHSLLIN